MKLQVVHATASPAASTRRVHGRDERDRMVAVFDSSRRTSDKRSEHDVTASGDKRVLLDPPSRRVSGCNARRYGLSRSKSLRTLTLRDRRHWWDLRGEEEEGVATG